MELHQQSLHMYRERFGTVIELLSMYAEHIAIKLFCNLTYALYFEPEAKIDRSCYNVYNSKMDVVNCSARWPEKAQSH